MVLRSDTTDGLHCGFIGDEFESGTRHFAGDAVQKFEGEADAFRGMVCHEASREEFGGGTARRERALIVPGSVLQQINAGERSGIWRGNASVAVPGSAVHPDLALTARRMM